MIDEALRYWSKAAKNYQEQLMIKLGLVLCFEYNLNLDTVLWYDEDEENPDRFKE
jgi:hypothetical protein